MGRSLILIFVLPGFSVVTVAGTCGGRVVSESSRQGVYHAEVAFPTPELTAKRVGEYARCAALADKADFARVTFLEDNQDALTLGGWTTHQRYGSWLLRREILRAMHFSQGQVLCVRRNCILRFADSKKHVEVRVLSGVNPLLLSTGGLHLEIVDAWAWDRGTSFAFVRSDSPLNADVSHKIYTAVTQWIPFPIERFFLRNDLWFIQIGFPQFFPFAPEEKAPSKEEFEQTVTFECTTTEGEAVCRRWWGN